MPHIMTPMCIDITETVILDCFRTSAQFPGATVDERDDALAVRTTVPHPFFNGVPRAALRESDAEERIREIAAPFREARIPFRWWITPSSAPANLVPLLQANGFRHVYDAPGMTMELDSLPEPQPIEGVSIERILDSGGLRAWARIFGVAFHRPEPEWDVWHSAFMSYGFDGRWRHFVAYLDGEPVATTSVITGDEIGGIYHVATLPHARGRGIGAAVTLAGLHETKRAGCRVAGLQSSAMAVGVYETLGFKRCCELTVYDWRPEYDG
jgi:GNAT superfamily N-acetyltransferase